MAEIVWTREAARCLEEIHDYIAADSPAGAHKVVSGINEKIQLLRFHPRLGQCYEIIIYWSDEDQAFIAEVPELPGCAADGETYGDALKSVQKIIGEWIETARSLGREIPKPKGRLVFA